jgi:hypothetical protein
MFGSPSIVVQVSILLKSGDPEHPWSLINGRGSRRFFCAREISSLKFNWRYLYIQIHAVQ